MNLSLEQAKGIFLNYCRVRNLSPATVRWYDFALDRTLKFLRPNTSVQDVTIADLREFIAHILGGSLSKTSVNHSITATKTFFTFLEEEGYLSDNPARRLEKIKTPKVLIQPFSHEQVAALLEAPNTRRFAGVRDRALILLLLDTGLRVSEAINLELEDINWHTCTIRVMGKGSKERDVPFGRMAKSELQAYLYRRGDTKGCKRVFVSEFGDPYNMRVFQENLARYGNVAGLTGVRVSPHTCRHTFAVNWIRSGGDVFHLQRILGHSSLEICRVYVNLVTDDLQRAHQSHSPMDKLLGEVRHTGKTRLR